MHYATAYVLCDHRGGGGGFQMIALRIIVSNTATVKFVTVGGFEIDQKLI